MFPALEPRMVHHKFQKFLIQQPDLSGCSHFDFFDGAPELSEADACNIWLSCLTALAKDSDATTGASLILLKERYYADRKNGALKQYWSNRRVEQEAERSEEEARVQTAIAVNRTTARVMRSAEKNAVNHLDKFDDSVSQNGESSSPVAARMSLAPPSSSSPSSSAPSFKKRKRSTTNGGWTSTTTKTSDGPDLSSRKERFTAMDQSRFWELRSGRTVEEALYNASLKQKANFKMRSYAIDFGCERTKALFTKDEWKEMKELDDFQLPRLLESTERYLCDVRKALVKGQHVASVPVPKEDRYSCELALISFLSWTQLYIAKPCPSV